MILEYSLPKSKGKVVIDTYIRSTLERTELAIEFKYDRQIPSGKNAPRPQKAGKIFNDISRLIQFNQSKKDTKAILWVIYFTDKEMGSYLRNPNNGLVDFYELPKGEELTIDDDYVLSKSKTFIKSISGPINCKIKAIWNEKMPKQHELRVYEISP